MKQHLAQTVSLAVFLKITANDGSGDQIRVWNGTRNKIVGGEMYYAYPLEPSRLQATNGLKADNLEITAVYSELFNAATLRAKKWMGAAVEYRVMNYKDFSMGHAERRLGFIGKTDVGRFAAKPEIVSLSSRLAQPVGRTCQSDCDVVNLGDSRCTVDLNGWTADGFKIKTTGVVAAPLLNRQQFSVTLNEAIVRGLRGKYYSDTTFTTLAATRLDSTVNFDFGTNSPIAGVPADNFSVLWEGFVTPQFSHTYTFSVEHDDGIRLYVDNLTTPLIDQWSTLGTHTATISLTAGVPVAVKLEYKEEVSAAKIKLRWSSSSVPLEIIPATALTPPSGYALPSDLYRFGKIKFLSGNNEGAELQILANTGTALTLYLPVFYSLAEGDEVELTVGCDRKIATCVGRFANGINHRGFFPLPGRQKILKLPA